MRPESLANCMVAPMCHTSDSSYLQGSAELPGHEEGINALFLSVMKAFKDYCQLEASRVLGWCFHLGHHQCKHG
jgi:hypothetical protein